MMLRRLALMLSAACLAAPLFAADDPALEAARDKIGKALGVPRDAVNESPLPGIYEVLHEHDFAYATADGKYLLRGDLINIESGEEITENHRRLDRLAALASLGDQNFIEFAPPPPIAAKYLVTVFTDVDCGYCRKLHSQIDEYNAKGIAIRYAFYPRSGPNTESWYRAEAVWCSADRKTALTRAKLGQDLKLKGTSACPNPVDREYKLAEQLGIRGTPMLVLPNGDVFPGYAPPSVLAAKLAELDAAAVAPKGNKS
jgi:thiol:disulfide interchange protein DsbC